MEILPHRTTLPGSIVGSRPGHTVRFYETDESLGDAVAAFLLPALREGHPCFVIATEEHGQAIRDRLTQARARADRILFLDARATLRKITLDDNLDAVLFATEIGGLLVDAGSRGLPHFYAEMVDLLWRDGKEETALRLEGWWNELAATRSFRLLCGYHVDRLHDAGTFDAVSAAHPECAATDGPTERDREVATAQDLPASGSAALGERERVAPGLEGETSDLLDLFDNLPVSLHWLDGEGRILRANQADLDLLGHAREEYVGRSIADFHVDAEVIADLLARWGRGEPVRDYPARLRHKDGSIRHVGITSKTKWEKGRIVHTNCFTQDVTERREAEELRSRAAAIVESSDDAIISKDLNGIITSWNRGAQRLFGYTADEIVGQSIARLMPPDHTNDFPTILKRLRRGERIEHFETVRMAKDGRRIHVSLTISPLRNAEGKIIGASKIARDITERKRSEALLRASEERLESELAEITRLHALSARLLSEGSFGAALKDVLENAMQACGARLGNVQVWHPQTRTLEIVAHHGFDDEFLDHFRTVRVTDGTSCGRAAEAVRRIVVEDVQTDPAYAPHREVAAKAGYRAVQSTPLVSHEGKVLGILSTHFADAGRLSPREERLLDLYARHAADVIERFQFERALQEADQRKDEFIAVLAHELRNPLAPVRNAAHYLKLKQLADPDVRQPLEMIDRQVNLMSRLIEDLLDVSRITRGVLELRRERVLLSDLIEAAVEACRHEVDARRHTVRVHLPEGEPLALYADRARLIQVLCNLLTNAAKYSPPGGRIDLSAEVHSNGLEISVRDQGVGIPPEKLSEIFDLFAQLDRSLERQGGGLGIGLTLARQIVELHQGTIEARSEGLGKGSEFVLRLPMLPARTPKKVNKTMGPTGNRRRILVADDNRDSADSLAMLLGRRHEVHRAYDGAAAFELAAGVLPEVMLLDIGMPKLDGYEVARRVRQEPWGSSVYLVALSGWGRDEDKRRASEAGFDAHLVKPATPEALDRLLAGIPLRAAKLSA